MIKKLFDTHNFSIIMNKIIMNKNSGFTVMELLTVISIIMVLVTISIPSILTWLHNANLNSAVRDLYSNMQWTKLNALKSKSNCAVIFDLENNCYYIDSSNGADNNWTARGDNTNLKTIDLSRYKGGVCYGHGSASADIDGSAFVADNISYGNNVAIFTRRGFCSNTGSVYLQNVKDSTRGVGTRLNGVIYLKGWANTAWR